MYKSIVRSSLAALVVFPLFGISQVNADDLLGQGVQIEEKGVNALEGVTVGVDAVYNHSDVKNEEYYVNVFLPSGDVGKVIPAAPTKQKRCNIDPSINVGYSYFNDNWYIGVAGEISFGRNRKTYVKVAGPYSAEAETVGFSSKIKIKGGYYFDDLKSAIYLIAGLKWRNVETKYKYIDQSDGEIHVGSKAKLSHPLYVVGVGVETPIYKKLSVSVEYEYAWRNSRDASVVNNDNFITKVGLKQSLKEHNFKLGVKYHI